jgi:HAD superfamily hydrolase (TIGR01509 family)
MSEPFSSAVEIVRQLRAPLAVAFDFDHTLGIDNKLERTVGVEMLERLAMEGGCGFDADEATAAMEAALAAFRGGPISLEEALRAQFERVACRGADFDAAIAQFRETVCQRAPDFIEALPGARELLEALDEASIPHAILTNGWSPLQEEKARLVGFDGAVFVSDVLGAWKPAKAAFQTLVEHFGVSAERIWYVGDDPVADAAGARAAGLISVWFDWERRSYAPNLTPPHLRVHELGEVTALLQGRGSRAPKASL